MKRRVIQVATVAAAAAPLLVLSPALAHAAPGADARGVNESTAEVTFTNDTSTPLTCGALVHFFGSPLSWFGWPPAVTVAPNSSASQMFPFISPGIHTARWTCQGAGGSYSGDIAPVAVGGLSIALVDTLLP